MSVPVVLELLCSRNTAKLFEVSKEPPPGLPSKHKHFFFTQIVIINVSYFKQIMHYKSNHKSKLDQML